MTAKIWHDAHHLKLILTCCFCTAPAEDRTRGLLNDMHKSRAMRLRDSLRKSRRLRRLILKQARSMLQFKIACALSGIKPATAV